MSCFVCFELCDDPSPCMCTDRYVHPACLRKLKQHGYTKCYVCLARYENSPTGLFIILLVLVWIL